MGSIGVTMNVSLDGVVQGPGRADEDTRGGFPHGGWGMWHQDDVLVGEMAAGMSRPGALLLGRRTWEDFAIAWGRRTDGNPFTAHLDAATKYVVSTTLDDVSGWRNSTLLRGDATRTVAELKAGTDGDLSVIGSAALVRHLHAADLVDHYTLVIHPLTLGAGARMFDGPAPLTRFTLTRTVPTTSGVIVACYDRER